MLTSASNKNKLRCVLICVGSELLRGKINTHASHLARRLASIGLALNEENTVSDEQLEITAAVHRALNTADVVFVSGGLGPTFDDLTREAASAATGCPLRLSAPLLRGLRDKFRRARYRMPAANARQAYMLEGAKTIPNAVGTAPGQWLEVDGASPGLRPPPSDPVFVEARPSSINALERWSPGGRGNTSASLLPLPPGEGWGEAPKILILLPGPPAELYPMLDNFVLPRLRKLAGRQTHLEAHMHFVGAPESVIDHKIRPIIARESARSSDPIEFTILARLGLVDFDVFVSSSSAARARKRLAGIVHAVRKAAGDVWYGTGAAYPLEKAVGDHLRARGATLAVAESCTGGLLAGRLTDIAGSSDYFLQSWVVYSNAAKTRAVGVPDSILKKYGSVSRPVAVALAQGARREAKATWGVGITGIAGPGGGSPQKPVGLVYIAWVSGERRVCRSYRFHGSRGDIRERAVLAALDMLRHAR